MRLRVYVVMFILFTNQLGCQGCDQITWSVLPKFLTDLAQVMLTDKMLLLLYNSTQERNMTSTLDYLYHRSINPIVHSFSSFPSFNLQTSISGLSNSVATFSKISRPLFVVCICLTDSEFFTFLKVANMLPQLRSTIWRSKYRQMPLLSGIEDTRWIIVDPPILQGNNFSCRVAMATVEKQVPSGDTVITVSGCRLVPDPSGNQEILSQWSRTGFKTPISFGLMDNVTKDCLKDRLVRVAVLDVFPFMKRMKIENGRREWDGIEFRLLTSLAEYFGFRVQLILTPDRQWGHKVNETWTGLIGMVYRGDADLSITSFSQTYHRKKDIDYVYTHFMDPVAFVTRAPGRRARAFIIVRSFQLPVHLAVLSAALMTAGLVHYMSKVAMDRRNRIWRFTDALWFVLTSLTLRSEARKLPSRSALRLVVATWWLFAIVVMSAFSGALTSFLNVPEMEESVDTTTLLMEAVKQGRLLPSTVGGSSISTNFLVADEGDFLVIGQSLKKNPHLQVSAVKTGVELTLFQRTAFIFPKAMMEGEANLLGREKFRFSTNQFYSTLYSMGIPKGSSLNNLFTPPIRRLAEGGLLPVWSNRLFVQQLIQVENNRSSHSSSFRKPIALSDMQGTFILLGLGYLLALVALASEYLISKYIASNNPK